MKITVIGTGLIGGSMALDLKKRRFTSHVVGVDQNNEHLEKALELGIIDERAEMNDAIADAELVIIAVPVDKAPEILEQVLDNISPGQTVMDVGSIKANICNRVAQHPKRDQFVATHPIAGTEYSGPDAAHYYLFDGKVNIITDKAASSPDSLSVVEKLFKTLKMNTIYMDAAEHDRHIAYVSHLSHITSFTLGLTVLELEKDEKSIFNMAGSGFASTVRLAKSSPDMWAPIFQENKDNLTDAIDAYIEKLNQLKKQIESGSSEATHHTISEANQITRILEGIELKNQAATIKK
ncbi:MAG: prephenate dehydrogenase [Fulvivirga sp.]